MAGTRPIQSSHPQETQELIAEWSLGWTAPFAAADPQALEALGLTWIPAAAPGTVAAAVRAAGAAASGAPARLDSADWWYRTRFTAQPADGDGQRLVLSFDGLATVADVWLDGALILHSENMFLGHAVDVTAHLAGGAQPHELTIRFAALEPLLGARPHARAGGCR